MHTHDVPCAKSAQRQGLEHDLLGSWGASIAPRHVVDRSEVPLRWRFLSVEDVSSMPHHPVRKLRPSIPGGCRGQFCSSVDPLTARRLKRAPPWCVVGPVANVIARGRRKADCPRPEACVPELAVPRHGWRKLLFARAERHALRLHLLLTSGWIQAEPYEAPLVRRWENDSKQELALLGSST